MTALTIAQQLSQQKTAIAFSSGFFGFYHHAGALKAIIEQGITPLKVSGTSAGSIVAALYAAGLPPDDICDALLTIKRRDFWDFSFPFTRNGFGWLKGERFKNLMDTLLPVHDFADCKIPLSVGVYTIDDGRSRQLSSGDITAAVRASSAVPYLFQPIKINNRIYWDGGFAEKTPLGNFVNDPDIDSVIICHMPPREERNGKKPKSGIFSGLKFFADTPLEERIKRDQVAVNLLRQAGKEVVILAPERIWLGPFTLDKAKEAMDFGYTETLKLLESTDNKVLGCSELK